MLEKTRCGHFATKSYADAHGGLCRKCHANFAILIELEKRYGEDALIEYWYSALLANMPESKEEIKCFISHLIDFYQQKLIETPSRQKYIKKMLFMLKSLLEPFDIETQR
jgi:hypothetical protein